MVPGIDTLAYSAYIDHMHRGEVETMTASPEVPDADTALGLAIHTAMFRQRYTQTRLARELGIDQSALSKKLHGSRPWTFAEFIGCADRLRIDARELLSEMWGPNGYPGPGDIPGSSIDFHGSPFKHATAPSTPGISLLHRVA